MKLTRLSSTLALLAALPSCEGDKACSYDAVAAQVDAEIETRRGCTEDAECTLTGAGERCYSRCYYSVATDALDEVRAIITDLGSSCPAHCELSPRACDTAMHYARCIDHACTDSFETPE